MLRLSVVPFYGLLIFVPNVGLAVAAYIVRQISINMAWPIDSTFIGEVLPARELLGDMLLELGRFDEAAVAYRETLDRRPGRFNSLFGAGRAFERAGQEDEAELYYRKLAEQCPNGDASRERLQQARAYLAERRNSVAKKAAT